MVCRSKRIVFGSVLILSMITVVSSGAWARPMLKYAPTALVSAESDFLSGKNNDTLTDAANVSSTSTDRSVKAWALCLESYAYMELKQQSDALNALNSVVTQYSDISGAVADAYLQTAYIKQSSNDSDGANQAFSQAKTNAQNLLSTAKDASTKHLAHMILSEVYFGQGNYLSAIDEARTAIKIYPHSEYPTDLAPIDTSTSYTQETANDQAAYAKLLIGLGYAVKGGLYPNAGIDMYTELLNAYAGTKACAEAQYRSAEEYYLLKRTPDANGALDALTANYYSNDTWSAWGHYLKGYLLIPTGEDLSEDASFADIPGVEWDTVIGQYYAQTIPMVRSKLAKVEIASILNGRYQEAEDELNGILSDHPELSNECTYAKRLLALTYVKEARYDDAIAKCNEVLSVTGLPDKQASLTQYCKGLAYSGKGDADGTITALTAALINIADIGIITDIRFKLAEAYGIKKDKTSFSAQLDAIEQNSLVEASNRALALYKKGTYLQSFGDNDGAKAAFQAVQAKYADSYLSTRAAAQIAKM